MLTTMQDACLVAALQSVQLRRVHSRAVRKIGFHHALRMAAVVFPGRETVYGYPHLSDEEIRGLLQVIEQQESLGHYISSVIKKNHDHEHVAWDPPA